MQRYHPGTALIIVDVQNDFADPAGGLSVAGGDAIIPTVNGEIAMAVSNGAMVVATQDWHPATTPHFAKDGGIWPVHCVEDTWGAELHPALQVPDDAPRVRKGVNGEDGYSGFTTRDPETGETAPTPLEGLLREAGIERVVVVGLATDYCVKATALDAVRLGFETALLTDAIAAVDLAPGDGARALDEMAAAGVSDLALGDAMIRGLLRLGIVGVSIGYAVDRLLAETAKGDGPEPIRSLVVIDAPIERVWAELADIEGQTRWMHDMKSVRILTDGPVGVGTLAEADVRIFGIGVTDPVTVTEFQPPTRFAISHDGTFKGGGAFDLESGPDGTTTIVRWEETLIPPILPNLGAAVGQPVLSAVFQADLERLRDLVEGRTTEPVTLTEPPPAPEPLPAPDAGLAPDPA